MKALSILVLFSLFIASCKTNNHVISNSLFQKRKYNKGWYINFSKNISKKNSNDKSKSKLVQKQTTNKISVSNVVETNKKVLTTEKPHTTQQKKSSREFIIETNESIIKEQSYLPKNHLNSKPSEFIRPQKREVESFSLASFIILLVNVLLILFSYIFLFEANLLTLILIMLFMLISTLSIFIFSINGLINIANNPIKYGAFYNYIFAILPLIIVTCFVALLFLFG